MTDPAVLLSTFGLVFVAELGDKTQLATIALAARHPWRPVLLGAAAAFALLNLLAVAVGRALFLAVPLGWIRLASAALFAAFGVLALRGAAGAETDGAAAPRTGRPLLGAFTLILLAELGDKTQLATASLAAQHDAPAAVFAGSTAALWAVALIGVLAGRRLLQRVSPRWLHSGAGLLFLAFAAAALAQAAGWLGG